MVELRELPNQAGPPTRRRAVFRCRCGNETVAMRGHVRTGNTKSCGCLRGKNHGFATHPLYPTWWQMMQRCHNHQHHAYERYGGRGVKVCDHWHEVGNFVADMAPRPEGHTLDREDNDGDYRPENCRWATRREQQNNRRNTSWLTVGGETRTLKEWAKVTGLKYNTIRMRRDRGKSPEDCLKTI